MKTEEKTEREASDGIEVFVQAEGRQEINIIRLSARATVAELLDEAVKASLIGDPQRGTVVCLLEDSDVALRPTDTLKSAKIIHRSRVHLHRCHRVDVTAYFNGANKNRGFPPSATIATVTAWAVGTHGFNLTPTDAVEHVLQVSGSTSRPDEDVHLGTLTTAPMCAVSFDLVPKRRVEG
jgi:hypothetical protein